jgi:hypothetical protein
MLNELTAKDSSTFNADQITSISNILVKIANLSYIPADATKGFLGTISNLGNAPVKVFSQLKNVSNM